MRRAVLGLFAAIQLFGAGPRIGTFKADATPEMGEPLIWVTPTTKVEDPLWAKGVVIDDGRARYVLCALDWCGIGGSTYALFRNKVAQAAGVDVTHVRIQTIHQHTAPYIDGDAYALMRKVMPTVPLLMSDGFLERVTDRLAAAVRDACGRMQPFDQVGTGTARVEQVASQRRIIKNGKVLTRYSSSGKDPAMAAEPEGFIDPDVRTVTFARGKQPIVRLHFYATHPQTFCCDGRVSADFVGAAREAVEAAEKIPQVYFTGCSGNVTVGKYNDGQEPARRELAKRLEAALRASAAATQYAPAGKLVWRSVPLDMPKKPGQQVAGLTGQAAYRAAISAAFAERRKPIDVASLGVGGAEMVFLPGEPFLEYQKYAQGLGKFVAVAGYGDISPGYICTDRAHGEGGYEPSASEVGPGTEAAVKEAIRELLGRQAR